MRIDINGSLLYFDIENAGLTPNQEGVMHALPPMIILHGGPGYDHTPYKFFFSTLRDLVQIIYIDQYGNGRSDPGVPENWNFDRWTSDIYEFCQKLHIQKPIIFGHSWGSMVALEYAIRYPDQLQKLILCSTTAKLDENKIANRFYKRGGEKSKKAFLNFFSQPNEKTKEQYKIYCAPYYNGQNPIDELFLFYKRVIFRMELVSYFYTHLFKEYDCRDQINRIQVPTLLITGEEDPITGVGSATEIAEKLRDYCKGNVIIPKTSHNVIWEKPEEVQKNIRHFLTNNLKEP